MPANTARYRFHPVTGLSEGLLVEAQRTNLLLRSEEFENAVWTATNLTVIVGPAQLGEGGVPVAGEVIDPRYHVNLAWHGRELDPAFQASLVVPETPLRGWDVVPPPASQPPVPPVIPA